MLPNIYQWILLLSVGGFVVSFHIYHKKRKEEPLTCIIGEDCEKVVRSKYSSLLLGIPNEVLGMLYYGVVTLLAAALLYGASTIFSFSLATVLYILACAAVLFSLILTLIQIFLLKEYCEYCLLSAAISLAIFILELF